MQPQINDPEEVVKVKVAQKAFTEYRMVSRGKFAGASRYPEGHRASFRIVVCAGDKLASTNITAHSERRGQSGMVLGGPSACRPRILEELARLMIIPFFFLCRIICYEGIPVATESNLSSAEMAWVAASN